LSWTLLTTAQTADTYIARGRAYLGPTADNLWAADTNFIRALQLSPTNETANALEAATRLLVLPQTTAGSNFLNSLGIAKTGRDLYNWTAQMPTNSNGEIVFPLNYNSATAIAFLRTNILAAIAASGTNLANIRDSRFTLLLAAAETTGVQDVTLDYGDIQMLRATLAMAQFAGYTLNAHNLKVVIPTLQKVAKTNGLTMQWVLATYPSLLTLATPSDLALSKSALTNAIGLYFSASDFIRNVRAPGDVRLFNLGTNDVAAEAEFRSDLTNALASLDGPTIIDPKETFAINASNYFSGAKTLRSLMPQFSGNIYKNNSLPDYTFGGILVNEPAYLTEALLRKELHSYAGIYIGDNGQFYNDGYSAVWDYNYNTGKWYSNGSFAVFVGTNQQAILVGHDDGDGTDDGTAFGLFAQFTLDKGGNWSFENNSVSGYGWFDKSGNFSGELDYANGVSVYLNGFQQSPLGQSQNQAGYYSGTYSGSSSGKLLSILAGDGEIFFIPIDSGGSPSNGGSDQLGSNNTFTNLLITGTTVRGTLNTNTLNLTGTYNTPGNGGSSGTFTATRTAKIPFDLPPVITANLPLTKTAQLGTNVTLSPVVTGSPPLCYQWYSNNVVIPNATTNALVIRNVQYASAGTYSVTIHNVAGETSGQVTLMVVPETTPPTNQITAPTPNLQVNSSVYTVTGKAGDNVAVSNVWYQLNQGGWQAASTANGWTDWSAGVTLTPGTNIIQAYAVDTSGNVSTTNTVSFVYVLSAVLTVQVSPGGTVVTNYNGALLQIEKTYSMSARTNLGFAFTGWTGSITTNQATLTFVMASNLFFSANFAETAKPLLTIKAPTNGKRMTNALAQVVGTASDVWGVGGVWLRLNSDSWNLVLTTNVYTNWTTTLALKTGTNTINAFAVNLGGNYSATNSLSVVSSNAFKLQLGFASVEPLASNGLTFSLELSRNLNGHIQVSTNLTSWATLTNFVGTNSPLTFRDPAATNSTERYYRAVIP
jgi:hypothetical protein